MLARVAVTVILIVLCLFAMTATAYAYFSCNISSGSNRIEAAHFAANISVADAAGTPVAVESTDGNTHSATLQPNTTYTVTLSYDRDNSTAKTGFFVITAAGCDQAYHTQQLGKDTTVAGGETDTITFALSVTAETTVQFLSHWGTSAYYNTYSDKTYYITDKMPPVAITLPDSGAAQGLSEGTESPTASGEAETSQPTNTTPSAETTTDATSSGQAAEAVDPSKEADSSDSAQPNTTAAQDSSNQASSDAAIVSFAQK